MPVVNSTAKPFFFANVVKDSRWLTLEVCREFVRNKCTRHEDECRYAHPPSNIEIQNGRVMCCFDYIKGRCQRSDPPCKYLHPPQHLKEQLLQNGRNNLIWRNFRMQPNLSTAAIYSIAPHSVPATPAPYLIQANGGLASYSNHPTTPPHSISSSSSMSTIGVIRSLLLSALPPTQPTLSDQSESVNTSQCLISSSDDSTVCTQQSPYWMNMNTAMLDSSSSSISNATYYSPVQLIQGVNTVPGMIPVLKSHQMIPPPSQLRQMNGLTVSYHCSPSHYQQMAAIPIPQQQSCYSMTSVTRGPVLAVNRY